MEEKVLDHYRSFGLFTYPGLYAEYFKSLPNDIKDIGELLRKNLIHRTTLAAGNVHTNADMKYGDMTKVPWWRQAEDDTLTTAVAIIAELFRRDEKGLTHEREVEDKVVLTCRYVAILMASILKTKNIPARVRSGFAGYFEGEHVAWDHWINEYWSREEKRWVVIDIDGSWHKTGFDLYDIPKDKFNYSADVWISVRNKQQDENHFNNAGGFKGLRIIALELFYDFHSIMNSEILYLHSPKLVRLDIFPKLSESKLQEIDALAQLMQNPDNNFDKLQNIWNSKKEFRLLKGSLL